MRIVTWNCGMALDRKAPNLLRLIRTLRSFRSVRRNPWMFSTATVSPACGSVPIQNKGLAVLCRRFALQAVGKRQVGDSRSGSWCGSGFQLAGGLGLPDRTAAEDQQTTKPSAIDPIDWSGYLVTRTQKVASRNSTIPKPIPTAPQTRAQNANQTPIGIGCCCPRL